MSFFTCACNDCQPCAAPRRRSLPVRWPDGRLASLILLLVAVLIALGFTADEVLQMVVASGLLVAHCRDARRNKAAAAEAGR